MDSKDANVGILVDTVLGVTRIPRKNVEPPPSLATKGVAASSIVGIAKLGEELVIILDIEKLLNEIKEFKVPT